MSTSDAISHHDIEEEAQALYWGGIGLGVFPKYQDAYEFVLMLSPSRFERLRRNRQFRSMVGDYDEIAADNPHERLD